MPDGLIELVGAETHGADDGRSDEGVINATEELHDSLFFNNIGDGSHHAVLGFYLHMDFNCIE